MGAYFLGKQLNLSKEMADDICWNRMIVRWFIWLNNQNVIRWLFIILLTFKANAIRNVKIYKTYNKRNS